MPVPAGADEAGEPRVPALPAPDNGPAVKPRILVVDDEPAVREAIRRQAGALMEIDAVATGEEGVDALATRGPWAVVVADYRLPGLSGVAFLRDAQRRAPHTVRVLLAGRGDIEGAVAAVNEGHVFRLVTKPCPAAVLRQALVASLAQHRLIVAEREVLEQTLAGVVRVLTEILEVVSPDAFGRAGRAKACVRHMAAALGLADGWQYEVAAMLSQIGCITLSPDTLAKVLAGQALGPAERDAVAAVPRVAAALIARVPRLEPVALPDPNPHRLALVRERRLARGGDPHGADKRGTGTTRRGG